MSRLKFGARLSRLVIIQSQETAKGTVLTGVTREGTEPYKRYAQLTPIDRLRWSHVKEATLECERLGYWSVVLPYHIRMEGGARYENWTMLSALASITKCVRLHHLVICNGFFHPPWLAKAVTTIDHISEGRFMLGLGIGYAKEEFVSYGYPFPPPAVRLRQLDEALVLMKKMWTEEHPSFRGKYYTIEDATGNPKTVTAPFPPVIIGGKGPKMMKLAAKHANVVNIEHGLCNWDGIESSLTSLEKACNELGRDFDEIEKSCGSYIFIVKSDRELREKEQALSHVPKGSILVGTPDRVIDVIQKYVDMGFTYFTFRFEDLPDLRGLRVFAESVIPAFK